MKIILEGSNDCFEEARALCLNLLCLENGVSSHFETGTISGCFIAYVEDYSHSIFFDALDTITHCISIQLISLVTRMLEAVLLKGSAGECYDDELVVVMQLYSEDLEE